MLTTSFNESFGLGKRKSASTGLTDPLWTSVTSLLHFDGADGSNVIVDQKPETWVAGGNAKLTNTRSKFGTTSAYFDGNGDEFYCADTYFAAGSVTAIEAWIFLESTADGGALFSMSGSSSNSDQFFQIIGSEGKARFYKGSRYSGTALDVSTAAGVVPINEWVHVALVLTSKQVRIYVNGVLSATRDSANNATWSFTGEPFRIGRNVVRTYEQYQFFYKGFVDDFRITNGNARYTNNFEPPSRHPDAGVPRTGSDPYVDNVVSLMYFQGQNGTQTFVDETDKTWITSSSNTSLRLSSSESIFGNTSLEVINVPSLFLDHPDFVMGKRPYTIEYWVKVMDRPTDGYGYTMLQLGTASDGTNGFISRFFNFNGGWDVFTTQVNYSSHSAAGPDYSSTPMPLPWVHQAIVSNGTTLRLFTNGVPSTTPVNLNTAVSMRLLLGSGAGSWEDNSRRFFIGAMRVTRDVERYTSTFDPTQTFVFENIK